MRLNPLGVRYRVFMVAIWIAGIAVGATVNTFAVQLPMIALMVAAWLPWAITAIRESRRAAGRSDRPYV